MRDKRLKFIQKEIGIDASPLPDDSVNKLCQYALNAKALEMPAMSKFDAKECGMKITLGE